jgi:hypothetical protein
MKDEGTNLFIMTNAFKQSVSFEKLVILAPFEGVCFGHALSKACQYATSNEKVSLGLQLANTKFAQPSIQACITWPKKSGKRKGIMDKNLFGYATTEVKHIGENKVCFESDNIIIGL